MLGEGLLLLVDWCCRIGGVDVVGRVAVAGRVCHRWKGSRGRNGSGLMLWES